MSTVREIIGAIEQIAPSNLAEDWDNPGLQVGSPAEEARKVLMSLDPTMDSLIDAVERNAQMLITHHPLILRPLLKIDRDVFPGNIIHSALQNHISIFSAHTNLDVADGGINDILASLLELKETQVLKPLDRETGKRIGLGRIGHTTQPLSLSEMITKVKKVLGTRRIQSVGRMDLRIRRVAVVGGSGGRMIPAAAEKGADLLITGDISYHNAQEALNAGLAVIDAGHFYTEKVPFARFSDRLNKAFRDHGLDVSLEICHREKDPTAYAHG